MLSVCCSSRSAGLSLPTSPTSLTSSTASNTSSPEFTQIDPLTAASRDDDVISESIEQVHDYRRQLEDLTGRIGSEMAGTAPPHDDVITDAIEQVRDDDVTFASHGDVTGGGFDAISIEGDKQAYDTEAQNTTDHQNDDADTAVNGKGEDDDGTESEEAVQSMSLCTELLAHAENEVSEDAELEPQSYIVGQNEPPGDFTGESRRSNDETTAEHSGQEEDTENTYYRKSPPVVEGTGSYCLHGESDSSAQSNDTMVEMQSSGRLATNSPDFESNSSSWHDEIVKRAAESNESDDDDDDDENKRMSADDQPEKTSSYSELVEISTPKSEAPANRQQSPFNEDASENSTTVRFPKPPAVDQDTSDDVRLISRVPRTSPDTGDDELSCVLSKNSHRDADVGEITELIAADGGERSWNSKTEDVEVLEVMRSDGAEDNETQQQGMDGLSTSSGIRCLDTTISEMSPVLEISSFRELEETVASQITSSSSSSSSSSPLASSSPLLLTPVKDEIAAGAKPNAPSADQTLTAARDNARSNEADAKLMPRRPQPPPSPSSLSSSSSSAYSETEVSEADNTEYCIRQSDPRQVTPREDTFVSETYPDSSPTSRSPPLPPSSSPSSPDSADSHVEMSFSESAAESTDDRREFIFSSKEPVSDKRKNTEELPVSQRSATVFQTHVNGDHHGEVDRTKGSANPSEKRLKSDIYLSQKNYIETDTKLAEHHPSITVENSTDYTESELSTANSPIAFENNKKCSLNGNSETQNILLPESTTSEYKQQGKGNRNQVDLGREPGRQSREYGRCITIRTELPTQPLSAPPYQRSRPVSRSDINCGVDDASYMEGNYTETENTARNNSSKTFTSIPTLYIQPPAVKHGSGFCKPNAYGGRTSLALEPEVNSSGLPSASGRTKHFDFGHSVAKTDSRIATKKSENREECRSPPVDVRIITASTDDSRAARSKANDVLVTAVATDSRGTGSHSRSPRSPTIITVKQISPVGQTSSGSGSGSSLFRTDARSPTSISAEELQKRGSALEHVSFNSSQTSFRVPANKTNEDNRSQNSYQCKSSQQNVLFANTDNGNQLSVEERMRANERERARRVLQSFLSRNAGLPANSVKQPVFSVGLNAVTARLATERRDTPVMRESESRQSNDVICDPRLSPGIDHNRSPPYLPPTTVTAAPQRAGFHDDDNNNNKMALPTTRLSCGDSPLSWQQDQVLYDVTLTLRSSSPGDDLYSRRRQNFAAPLSVDVGNGGDVTAASGMLPAGRRGVFVRRSLSVPVMDRSEAFVVPSMTARERDRVRPPHAVHRWPMMSPLPPRLKAPCSPALSVLGEYRYYCN